MRHAAPTCVPTRVMPQCYEPSTGKTLYTLDPKSTLPTTCVRFRPQKAASKTRYVLVSGGANGVLQHWHVTSQKCLSTIEEEDDELVLNKDGNTTTKRHYRNQIFTMEYNHDGTRFATAGKDYKVRLYDEATKSHILSMSRGFGKMTPGHSNRVFSVKFHPTDENILLSAGWDNTVQIWDTRVEGAVRNIFGPHICGDSMDIDCDGGTILTGSWRPEEQLQTWDYGTGSLIETFDWPVVRASPAQMCL
jgi:COMPASS component SWD3